MDLRLVLPAATAVSVALVAAGRFHPTVAFVAAVLGLGLMALHPWAKDRILVFFALLPAAAWLAGRPPWGEIAAAVILAGMVVLVVGRGGEGWSRESWFPLGAGAAAAVLVGLVAREAGIISGLADAIALIIILAAFRTGTAIFSRRHWLYATATGISTAPHLGPAGLIIGAIEAVFGLGTMAAPPHHRIAWAFGSPLALVALV